MNENNLLENFLKIVTGRVNHVLKIFIVQKTLREYLRSIALYKKKHFELKWLVFEGRICWRQ